MEDKIPEGSNNNGTSKLNYFIFGHNISHSLSPDLHNAGFKAIGLPHHYSIHETPFVDESVQGIIKRPDFGGASVTFPHKLQVGRLLDSVTPSAEKVGAINTIVARRSTDSSHFLEGDNTDWLGIKKCIERSCTAEDLGSSAALVLGAGGAARAACYAIQTLGLQKLLIVNRTLDKGQVMASHFTGVQSEVFGTLDEAAATASHKIRVIVACIPADDLSEEMIPTGLFTGCNEGVLVEMAYRPQVTGMMKAAGRYSGWKICRGVDVLEEQAYEQFKMWTGRDAPVEVMREAMQAKMRSNM